MLGMIKEQQGGRMGLLASPEHVLSFLMDGMVTWGSLSDTDNVMLCLLIFNQLPIRPYYQVPCLG